MARYDDKNYINARASGLCTTGHASSVWGYPSLLPPMQGHVIELFDSTYISKPCFQELLTFSDKTEVISLDFTGAIRGDDGVHVYSEIAIEWREFDVDVSEIPIYQFYFSDFKTAKNMALRVQSSARNKRKDRIRRARLDAAGGFHDNQIIEQIFEIQNGLCYYSRLPLDKDPKNYVIDHIKPIYLGGSDWPDNLALVIKEINTWKGGLSSKDDTLQWLAKEKGKEWLAEQKQFCKNIDRKRNKLNREFRLKNKDKIG